jgi:hypothetical protein
VLSFSTDAAVRSSTPETRRSFMSATQKALEVFSAYSYQLLAQEIAMNTKGAVFSDADSIVWSANKKLSWDDFKGIPDLNEEADALTYTTHQSGFSAFGVGNRFHVEAEVACCFIKTKSWVKAGMKTDYLLNHEQRHFDLAEVGAREFRKVLKTTNFTAENFQKQVQRITTEIDEKYKKLQQQYDRESSHSRIEEKQKEWDAKIDAMLKALEEYK